mmetsp:Transcript_3608/g.8017  ORF Transcript_3608/g.8017 Transcript_3608/m.8017 type:complete len:98 (+) Transcript_3608:3393-3686(+)
MAHHKKTWNLSCGMMICRETARHKIIGGMEITTMMEGHRRRCRMKAKRLTLNHRCQISVICDHEWNRRTSKYTLRLMPKIRTTLSHPHSKLVSVIHI